MKKLPPFQVALTTLILSMACPSIGFGIQAGLDAKPATDPDAETHRFEIIYTSDHPIELDSLEGKVFVGPPGPLFLPREMGEASWSAALIDTVISHEGKRVVATYQIARPATGDWGTWPLALAPITIDGARDASGCRQDGQQAHHRTIH